MTQGWIDRVIFTAVTGGVGNFQVGAAVPGYNTPALSSAVDGTNYHYAAQTIDHKGNITDWEVGTGIYTASTTTLTRVVELSSNANALVNFGSPPQVMITALAADFVVSGAGARPILVGNTTFFCRNMLGTVTVNNSSPSAATATLTGHGLSIGDAVVFSLPLDRQAITTTVASPCVVTTQGRQPGSPTPTAHGFAAGDPVVFYSDGAIAAGITEGTTYYVKTTPSSSTFTFSATPGGTAINTTVAQSGNCSVERNSVMNAGVSDAVSRSDGGIFYVTSRTANTFQFATAPAGAPIVTTSAAQGRISLATGNDSNTGLSLAQAFLTLQGAWNTIFPYDFRAHTATIQLALDCTYASTDLAGGNSVLDTGFNVDTWEGGGTLILQGDTTDIFSGGGPPTGGGRGTLGYAQDRVRIVASNIILSFAGPFSGNLSLYAMRLTQKNSISPGTAYGVNFNQILNGTAGCLSFDQQNGFWTSPYFINGSVAGSGGYDQIINTGATGAYIISGSSNVGSSAGIDIYGNVNFNSSFWDIAEATFLRTACEWIGKVPSFAGAICFALVFQDCLHTEDNDPFSDAVAAANPTLPLILGGAMATRIDQGASTAITILNGLALNGGYATPISGATITMPRWETELLINPAGTLATLSITLPPDAIDGQLAIIDTTQALTALTITGTGGTSVVHAPTTLAAGTGTRAIFHGANHTWYFTTAAAGGTTPVQSRPLVVTSPAFYASTTNANLYFVSATYGNNANSGAKTCEFTGSIAGTTLTVSAVATGVISVGDILFGYPPNFGFNSFPLECKVTAFGSGSGGVGTYTIDIPLTVASGQIFAAQPQATINTAVIAGESYDYQDLYTLLIIVGAGTYSDLLNLQGLVGGPGTNIGLGPTGAAFLWSEFGSTMTTIDGSATDIPLQASGAMVAWTVVGFHLIGNSYIMGIFGGAKITFSDMIFEASPFGSFGFFFFQSPGTLVAFAGNMEIRGTFSGGSVGLINATNGVVIDISSGLGSLPTPITWTFTGSPGSSPGIFILMDVGCVARVMNVTWTGALVTGMKKFSLTGQSTIDTDTTYANWPGNIDSVGDLTSSFGGAYIDDTVVVTVATNGGTPVAARPFQGCSVLTPAGTIAGKTQNLPANPIDGQPFIVSTTNQVTLLTLATTDGSSIGLIANPFLLAADADKRLRYQSATNTWYPG